MSTRNRTETSAALAGGRALRLVRDPVPEAAELPAESGTDASDPETAAAARRRSPRSLVRMMQGWSDAIDRDVRLILES